MVRFSKTIIFAAMLLFILPTVGHAQRRPAPDKEVLLKMVNDIRSQGCQCGNTYHPPAPPVKWNEKLEQAAQNHCNSMHTNSFFSHTGKDGSTVSTRVTSVKYDWVMCSENIGMKYRTEQAVIQGWLNSPSHCENMMNELFKDVGIARRGSYWTMVLAMPK